MSKLATADAYFSTINPIANKIHLDITSIKSSYEHLWHKLTSNEQMNIINETIIQPDITINYINAMQSDIHGISSEEIILCQKKQLQVLTDKNLLHLIRMRTGAKVISDELIGTYYDEHSSPFNYKTRSQMNLSLFTLNTDKDYDNRYDEDIYDSELILKRELPATATNVTATAATVTIPMKIPINEKSQNLVESENKVTTSNNFLTKLIKSKKSRNQSESVSPPVIIGNSGSPATQIPISVSTVTPMTLINKGKSSILHRNDDEQRLVGHSMNSMSSNPSDEDYDYNGGNGGAGGVGDCDDDDDDDDKNDFNDVNESNTLLEATDIKKGYDFLNNW